MRRTLLIILSMALAACSANPKALYQEQVVTSPTPLAEHPAEAIRLLQAEPLPINPSWPFPQWKITANEPRLKLGNTIANFRVFSVELKQGTSNHIAVNSWCVNACLGFSKYALTPYLLLVDQQGIVIAEGFGQITGSVGVINQALSSTVPKNGTYYLIVAADNRTPGQNIVTDSVMLVGSTGLGTPMQVGMGSYPFGTIGPYLDTSK